MFGTPTVRSERWQSRRDGLVQKGKQFQSLDITQENKGLRGIKVISRIVPSVSRAPCTRSLHVLASNELSHVIKCYLT